jgi:hypothetical protein
VYKNSFSILPSVSYTLYLSSFCFFVRSLQASKLRGESYFLYLDYILQIRVTSPQMNRAFIGDTDNYANEESVFDRFFS